MSETIHPRNRIFSTAVNAWASESFRAGWEENLIHPIHVIRLIGSRLLPTQTARWGVEPTDIREASPVERISPAAYDRLVLARAAIQEDLNLDAVSRLTLAAPQVDWRFIKWARPALESAFDRDNNPKVHILAVISLDDSVRIIAEWLL